MSKEILSKDNISLSQSYLQLYTKNNRSEGSKVNLLDEKTRMEVINCAKCKHVDVIDEKRTLVCMNAGTPMAGRIVYSTWTCPHAEEKV